MTLLNSITEEQFKLLISNSCSKAEVIKKAGLVPQGSNYKAFNTLVLKWKIDTSHFSGQSHWKGKTHNNARKIPLSEILIENSDYQQTHKIKNRLIKEGIFKHQCSMCQLSEWLNLKIPIELDHINGNNRDNRLENLRLLCPNCHALTPTYRGKNKNVIMPG